MRTLFAFTAPLALYCGLPAWSAELTISDAKLLPDNSSVSLSAKAVTYAGANFFYIEDSRCMGITEIPKHPIILEASAVSATQGSPSTA